MIIPINPDSIGDPNQTPVVYIGDAGEVLGIPDRMASIRTRVARWSAMANDPARSIENPSPMCLASAELAADVPALLADLDAAREALRRAEESIGAWTRAADRAEEECQRLQGLVEDARAERDRMRPVVEKARDVIANFRTSRLPVAIAELDRAVAAIETKERTDG